MRDICKRSEYMHIIINKSEMVFDINDQVVDPIIIIINYYYFLSVLKTTYEPEFLN